MKNGLSRAIIGLLVLLVSHGVIHTTIAQGCQTTVTVESGWGEASSTGKTVPISVTRSQEVRGLQMEINAAGLSARACRALVSGFDCWLSSTGNTTHLILTSLNGSLLPTSPDTIAEVDYDVDSATSTGKITLQAQNVLVAADSSQACSATAENGSFVVLSVKEADINGSKRVDGFDLINMSWAWASKKGEARYKPELDLSLDDEIGIEDLEILRSYFSQSVN